MQCMECYTTSDMKKLATLADERNIFTTCGRMADKGHSLRLEHVTDMLRKAHSSKACVPAKDLELAISLLEKYVIQFEDASGEIFLPALRIMHLTDMCPLTLRQRSTDFGEARFGTYEAIKVEIFSWLADNGRHPKGKLAVVVDAPRQEGAGDDVRAARSFPPRSCQPRNCS